MSDERGGTRTVATGSPSSGGTSRALPRASRHQRGNAHYPHAVAIGLILSAALHWAAFRFAPEMTAEVTDHRRPELTAVEIPPVVEIPPAPQAVARPAMPVVAAADVDADVTIAPTTFAEYEPPPLAPPPVEEEPIAEARDEGPVFTPFTTPPLLRNRDEVVDAITENYPRKLRAAGIGGQVMMWFHIDKTGRIVESRVALSSGFGELDAAAQNVAAVLSFSPARNRDPPVDVWVQIPIRFSVTVR